MEGVTLLVGTTKGAFIFSSDDGDHWETLAGW